VVDYEDSGWFSYDQVSIWTGESLWRGKRYTATVDEAWLHPSVVTG